MDISEYWVARSLAEQQASLAPATNYNFYTCHKTTLISFFRREQRRKSIRDRDQSSGALQDQVT